MMKLCFFLFLFIFTAHLSLGQEFQAKITNAETKSILSNVRVQILETGITKVSDENGLVNFPVVSFSSITVKIFHDGFEAFTETYECSTANHPIHSIELLPSHHALEEVEIVSVRNGKQNEVVPHIESKKIADLNTINRMNLMEGIGTMPGVQTMSTGVGIGKPIVRGLSGSRVVTYLQGIRFENQQWGSDHGLGITDLGISRVEIIKGPASLQFGADALGGVIFLIDDDFAAVGETEIQASSTFESVNSFTGNKVWVKSSNNKLRFSAGGGFNSGSDYQIPNGSFVKSSYFQDRYGRINMSWGRKRFFNTVRYSVQQSFVGIPGHTHDSVIDLADLYSNESKRAFRTPRQEINTHVGSWESNLYFKKSSIQSNIGVNYNQLTELEEKITIPAIRLNTVSIPYTIRWKKYTSNGWSFQSGIQGMVQTTKNAEEAEEKLIPNSTTVDNGIFGILSKKISSFQFQAGLRADMRVMNISDSMKTQKQFPGINGSFGVIQKSDHQTFRLNYSSGFRAPTVYELVADGEHHGSFRYEKGSFDLKSEYAHQLDFAYELNSEHVALVINPFMSTIQNYISLQSSDSVIESYPVYNYVQIKKAMLAGGDVGIHFHPHFAHFLHLESTYSFLYSNNQTTNTALDLIPQNRILSSIKLTFERHGKFQVNHIAVEHQYFENANRFGENESYTPAYQILNLGIKASYFGKHTQLLLSTGIKNILNTAYIPHVSQIKYLGIVQPGRSIYAQLQIQIKYKNK